VVRGGKFTLSEAGCNVPFIASRPGTIPAGTVCDELVDFTDVLPTFADVATAPLPSDVTLDGHSFRPLLTGDDRPIRPWVYCQLRRNAFIRDPSWRLDTSGQLFRVVRGEDDVLADPASEPQAREAFTRLRRALIDLVGRRGNGLKLGPALLRRTRGAATVS
jgi:hypothetical protein